VSRGQLERVAARHREDALRHALAERPRAHHERAVVVLQRASHDLGGRRPPAVLQEHRRQVGRHGRPGRPQDGAARAFADVDDGPLPRDQGADHVDRLVDRAAGVPTQVEDHAPGPGTAGLA
jgi:hypothetical protein